MLAMNCTGRASELVLLDVLVHVSSRFSTLDASMDGNQRIPPAEHEICVLLPYLSRGVQLHNNYSFLFFLSS